MNKIFKVIWNKVRNCYVVVSEITKCQHKASTKGERVKANVRWGGDWNRAAVAAVVASLLTFGGLAYSTVMADTAVNKAGEGAGVAIGEGSKAPKAENVAIGKGAEIKYSNGTSSATGDVIVGSGAVIDNYASQGGSIAVGKNATIENMTGRQESLFSLGQTKYHRGNFWGTVQIPDNPENVAGSIAIGDNTYARTGSIMIGSHNYRGQIGDQTVDTSKTEDTATTKGTVKTKDYGININATTLGTNSFNQGAFSSVIGAYSIISGKYNGSGLSPYGAQNFGATITGSLNSVESATSSSIYSGIANSIVGVANRASNSNGSLIFGAGNEIKNSITDISAPTSGGDSAKALQDSLMTAVCSSDSGGATLVIGGGNQADYTRKTQIFGVNNEVKGTSGSTSDYNMIDGFNNKVNSVSHLYTIGTNNHINDTKNAIVFGDNRYVSRTNDSIIIGSSDESDKPQYTTATDATIIGHNANAWGNRSMALGKDVYTTGDDSVAIGSGVAAYSKNSIAIGSNSDKYHKTAVTDFSKEKPTVGGIAIGMGTLTNASYGTAIGYQAMVTNADGYALGSNASVSADKGVAIGYQALATNAANALALGTKASASGLDNIAIGTQAIATGSSNDKEHPDYGQRMALGAYSNASGQASAAIGSGVNVNGNYSVGIGSHDAKGVLFSTNVSGNRAVGIGVQANVAGESAVGIGDTSIANGKQAIAIGKNANASNEDAFAFGTSANSSNKHALALGASANANREDSVALGTSAVASANNALALGTNANVSGDNGIAIGASVTEQDENKHVKSSMAAGINSTAIGTAASATGENSIVIGSYEMNQDGTVKNAQAVALDSMAFGTAANAWGQEGIALGKNTGAGQNAIAIGSKANAWKNHATAIGNGAVGGAEYGVAIGEGAIVTNRYKDNGKGEYVEDTEHPATDAVAIGHNALTNVNGGVALGYGSIADREAGKAGLDLSLIAKNGKAGDFSEDSSPVWTSTAAAVSIGNIVKDKDGKLAAGTITRQITGVAAGSEDYDAVNVAQLRQVVAKMHFYTVNESDQVNISGSKEQLNKENDGATKAYGMAAGYMTYTQGIGSTVGGSFSSVTTAENDKMSDVDKESLKYQGAGSVSYGTYNYNRNTDTTQKSAGVANSLVGQNNVAENSNAALIYGSANSITNSYRHIDTDTLNKVLNDNDPSTSTPEKITKIMQDAIADEKTGGMVSVVGSANTVDTAYMTQIQGVSNTVTGQESTDESKVTTHNYVGGFFNKLENGKSNYVIGTKNTVTSNSDSTANASNIVIGDNHTLTNGSHNVIIGSEDVETPKETPAARHGLRLMAAEETEPSKSPDNVVRIGHNAKATYDYSAALGAGSVASTKAGVPGYDPLTGKPSTSINNITWTSNWAAASIGDSTHTRQLTNVAAGTADTDAVNVAQLKAVMDLPVHIYSGGQSASGVYKGGSPIATDMKISKLQFDFGDGLKAQEVGGDGDKRVLVTLDKEALKDDPNFKGPKGDKGDTGVQGPKGDKGDMGATGAQGSKGDKGDTGVQGPKGDKGDTGATGPQGPAGKDGRDGKDGKDGGVGTVVDDGTNITVVNQEKDSTKPANYRVSLKDDITVKSVTAGDVTINKEGKGTINNLTNTTWDAKNITSGQAATEDQLKAATKNAVNYDGDDSKTITLREDTTIKNVADTTIEEGSKDAVNAGTVYNETRVAKDGTFVKQANTAGENLSALDNQVTANTESIYHMNGRISDLDNRVNKVGAGAAALAALHPLDFDPDDKWDFAVGYGNYRNANSIAFGAFYRPNEDTMFSLGTNFGNGENMFNAGLSFKIGQGSGITTSRTAMAKKIASLEDTVDKQDKKIAELEALVKEQGEMIRQYVGKK